MKGYYITIVISASLTQNPLFKWATLSGNTVSLKPYHTYEGQIEIKATDQCLVETQPIQIRAIPREIGGISYDYFRKMRVNDLDNPDDKEDWYYLVRQVGTGKTNSELEKLVLAIENSLSGNYTLLKTHARIYERPILIHVGDEGSGNLCHFPGDAGWYMPGHICLLMPEDDPAVIISHEDWHARQYHKTPQIRYWGKNGDIQQSTAGAISFVVGKNLQSFSEIPQLYSYLRDRLGFKFLIDMNETYDYDVQHLKRFAELVDKISREGTTQLTVPQVKCIYDLQVKEITGIEIDTSPVFCDNFFCSDVAPYSYFYNVPRYYCGDQVE